MRNLGLNTLRAEFLQFFSEKGHLVENSYSLIPVNDPSVLLVNAGMQPLKNYFTGAEEPPRRRMATCQKCFRTVDIDNVGLTSRHATLFEMLGNFSFGDYFKRETLAWGWEFLTKVLEMDPERLWPSVYLEDEEAFEIWNKEIGVPAERITKLGKDDNFWEIGTGPCGPCSEIYFDRGEKYGCHKNTCRPGCDCDRFVEIWNHVFSQFDRQEDGTYLPLEQKNIDTGMGLERLACMVQEVDSIFEVDTIKTIYDRVLQLAKTPNPVSAKVVTDHIKSTVFLIGDGVSPSNEGRGYVLRRVFRRATKHAMNIGIERDDFISLVDTVVEIYGDFYINLKEMHSYITKVVESEYDRFDLTLKQGLVVLEQYMATGAITGEQVFTLYDTYGFPVELTKEVLAEKGLTFDEAEFQKKMEAQKALAREALKDVAWDMEDISAEAKFDGYQNFEMKSKLNLVTEEELSLEVTPFYAEGGGQVSDTGTVTHVGGEFVLAVVGVRKGRNNSLIHRYEIRSGRKPAVGDEVVASVDKARRLSIARNHTATHLLHAVLREVLGTHVHQAGSLVEEERLRFDFTHFEALSTETILEIENKVNDMIFNPAPVTATYMPLEEAKACGAMALFGEKYGEIARVIRMGDYSVELCGGTHLNNTAEVGIFKILSEAGVAAGVRRIEATTGSNVLKILQNHEMAISKLENVLKTRRDALVEKVANFIAVQKQLSKENESLKEKLLASTSEGGEGVKVGRYTLFYKRFDESADQKAIRSLGDKILSKDEHAVFIAMIDGEKPLLTIMVGKSAVERKISAGDLIKQMTKTLGGGGGGRPNMAQASIKDVSKIDDAIKELEAFIGGNND